MSPLAQPNVAYPASYRFISVREQSLISTYWSLNVHWFTCVYVVMQSWQRSHGPFFCNIKQQVHSYDWPNILYPEQYFCCKGISCWKFYVKYLWILTIFIYICWHDHAEWIKYITCIKDALFYVVTQENNTRLRNLYTIIEYIHQIWDIIIMRPLDIVPKYTWL